MAAVLGEMADIEKHRRRHETLLAALPTSATYNVHRKRGQRAYRPSDFVRTERKHMSVEEAKRYMDAWAKRHNKRVEA